MNNDFVELPIKRGFNSISKLWEFCAENDLFICGGYARYCCSPVSNPKPVSDVDLYPKSVKIFEKSFDVLQEKGFEVIKENDLSYTFNEKNSPIPSPLPIQLIKPFQEARILTYGSIEEILNNFDFTVTRCTIISPEKVIVDKDFEKDEKSNHLIFKNIHCPISSLFRAFKYMKKGYWLNPLESIKLFQDWDNRDQEYKKSIFNFLEKTETFKKTGKETLTEKEIFELERLMMID